MRVFLLVVVFTEIINYPVLRAVSCQFGRMRSRQKRMRTGNEPHGKFSIGCCACRNNKLPRAARSTWPIFMYMHAENPFIFCNCIVLSSNNTFLWHLQSPSSTNYSWKCIFRIWISRNKRCTARSLRKYIFFASSRTKLSSHFLVLLLFVVFLQELTDSNVSLRNANSH